MTCTRASLVFYHPRVRLKTIMTYYDRGSPIAKRVAGNETRREEEKKTFFFFTNVIGTGKPVSGWKNDNPLTVENVPKRVASKIPSS